MVIEAADDPLRHAVARALMSAGSPSSSVPVSELRDALATVAQTDVGRDAGSLRIVATFTRAWIERSDDADVTDAVARLLDAARDAADVVGMSRRAAAATVVRTAMRHPRFGGHLGDRLLSALLVEP